MAKAVKKEEFNARTYMQLAIEEMNKSVSEPRPDGKVPPKVGAILLFPNGRIERAHRGELREGDHAEFTLIEENYQEKSWMIVSYSPHWSLATKETIRKLPAVKEPPMQE